VHYWPLLALCCFARCTIDIPPPQVELRRQRETFHSKLKDSAKPLILDKDGNKHFAADATVSLGSFQEIVDVCLKAAGSVCAAASCILADVEWRCSVRSVPVNLFVCLFRRVYFFRWRLSHS